MGKYRTVAIFAYIKGSTLTITNPFNRIPWVDEKGRLVAPKKPNKEGK